MSNRGPVNTARLAGALLACLAVAPPLLFVLILWLRPASSDFDIFYRAVVQFHEGEFRAIYAWHAGSSPYRYVPFSLLMLEPLAWLSLDNARVVWFALQYSSLVAALLLFQRTLRVFDQRATWICLLCVLCSFRGWIDACQSGQSTGFMLLAASAGLHAALNGSYIAMGAWTGFASALKVAPGIFFFPALFDSMRAFRRVTAGCLGLVVLATAMLVLRVGVDETQKLHHGWIDTVAADDQYVKVGHINDQSLKGFLIRADRQVQRLAGHAPDVTSKNEANGHSASPRGIQTAWGLFAPVLGGGYVLACALRRPSSPVGSICAFGLAACLFLVLSPTTFGYMTPYLIFPIGALLAARPGWKPLAWRSDPVLWITLLGLFAVYAVSGGELSSLNIHGRVVERLSLPLLSNLLLTGWLAALAFHHSTPRFARAAGRDAAN